MAAWIAVILTGAINLAGLAFAAGAVVTRLRAHDAQIEALPDRCKEQARVMDLEHLIECHPRTAKRRTQEMGEIVQ